MRRAVRWPLAAWLLILGAVLLVPAEALTGNEKSHTGRDHVRITKITPRTGADLPTPSLLPFHLEVGYTLESAPKGKLRVGVFRWRSGTSTRRTPRGMAPGLEPLLPPLERDIRKGTSVVQITTDPVALKAGGGSNNQVIVVVNIQDPTRRELCWATSYNFLRGELSVRPGSGAPGGDSIQVLSFYPRVGTLKTGHDHPFTVNLQYSLKSKPWGFVNLELGEPSQQGQSAAWYTVVVPVRRGTGVVKVTTRRFFLPAAYSNRAMELALPFRVDPLGGTVDVPRFGPWMLVRPDEG